MAGVGVSRPSLSAALLAWSKVLVRTDCMVEMVLSRDSLMFPPVMVSQAVQRAVNRSPVPKNISRVENISRCIIDHGELEDAITLGF